MAIKKTVDQLKQMLLEISHDLEKSERGNKAASQRVRKNTIQFAKIAKLYRKESVKEEQKGKGKKKAKKVVRKKAAKKVIRKKAAPKRKKKVAKKVARKKARR